MLLDLQNLTEDELDAAWNAWLHQAQVSNEEDRYTYSHGVFTHEPHEPSEALRRNRQFGIKKKPARSRTDSGIVRQSLKSIDDRDSPLLEAIHTH